MSDKSPEPKRKDAPAADLTPVTDQPDARPTPAVQFAPLTESATEGVPQNIELLLDVPLQVSAQLGKARTTVREVLQLRPGSLLELDKLAGEPVDIMVNGSLVARGEVVVVDEHFGVRVTEVIDRNRRPGSQQ